jgi:hypothetical protein
MEGGIDMALKRIVGTSAIAGVLGLSAIGLAGVANAAPAPQVAPGAAQHVQLAGWGHGGGWHGDGGRGGDRGWGGRGPGWGGPGWGGPPPPCVLGVCI